MKLFGKDGGPASTVWGYFFELKRLFSVVLLRFENGSREAYHSHAFNSLSWVLRGELHEHHLDGRLDIHRPSLIPVVTRRDTFHMVMSQGRSWVLSFRGPWAKTWQEWIPGKGYVTLTHGRRHVARQA